MDNRIRKATELLEKLRKERVKARTLFTEVSKKLELANEFKDCTLDGAVLQSRVDEFTNAANWLKKTERDYEAALDALEKAEKAAEANKTKKKIVSKTDDQGFWKTSI